MNVIRRDVALKVGLQIASLLPAMEGKQIQIADGGFTRFIGICLDSPVRIGDITTHAHFIVVDKLAMECILGEPWACRASLHTGRNPDGYVECTITSEDGHRNTTFQAVRGIPRLVNTRRQQVRFSGEDEADQ